MKANTESHKVYAREPEGLFDTCKLQTSSLCEELCDVTILTGGSSIGVRLDSSDRISERGAAIASTQG